MKRLLDILVMPVLLVLLGCTSGVENPTKVDALPAIYPDYIGVTIPAEIAPLNFATTDNAEAIDVVVRGSKGGELHVQGDDADFDIDDWHALTQQNKGGQLTFTVCATAAGVLMAKLMNCFSKTKINPLIGAAGVSAVPMAARVANKVGLEANPQNFLLMHAMGPNVAGVIGSAVAAGVLLALCH